MNDVLSVAELQAMPWMMDPMHIAGLVEHVEKFAAGEYIGGESAVAGEAGLSVSRMEIEGDTAIIPISGYLLDTVPKWMVQFGIEATGYDQICRDIESAVNDETVTRIMLLVSSQGGMVAGSQNACDAIFEARQTKNVVAHIEDLAASAAYRLSSQAEKITAAGSDTKVGSIGVLDHFFDTSKQYEEAGVKSVLIRAGELKGMGFSGEPITDAQIAATQENVDGLAANFVADIVRGRGMKTAQVKQLATGQVWLAKKATELGLIDEVTKYETALAGSRSAQKEQGAMNMAEQNETAAAPVDADKIRAEAKAEAATAAQNLLGELQAEFPDHPEFVIEQLAAGNDLQTAQAAYAGVLKERNTELQTELAEAKTAAAAKPKKPAGAPPLEQEGEPEGGSGGGDFMAISRERAEAKGISMTVAMSQINRENPGMHDAYRASCPPASSK